MEHVLGECKRIEGCIFDFPNNISRDKKRLLLYRDEHVAVLLNRFPYANGHLLVAPAPHLAELDDLSMDQQSALMRMISESCTILRKVLHPDGFNVGLNIGEVAGAGIPDHLHFHIVPRWNGDHNFMTVLAEIRAIPQHIETTYDLLTPHFEQLHLNQQL